MNRRLLASGVVARLTVVLSVSLATCAIAATSASAAVTAHGQLLHLAPHGALNTNTSDNWFGYNQGTLEKGDTLFNSISGNWTVPTATQHTAGQAEDSADWIGIGGGCVDSGCTVTDSTLIQTGTEQDVPATGAATYDAWYELVPAPEFEISNMTIEPGDAMHASISEVVNDANVWTITIQDLTRNETYTTTVPYSSTHATAEWIEETPLEIGTDAGFASLPNLTNPGWTDATVNGASADLQSSEQMDLTDSSGDVIGAPSAPNSTANGFDECTWASTCN
jgi:peptidase A4-like protein